MQVKSYIENNIVALMHSVIIFFVPIYVYAANGILLTSGKNVD